MKFSEFLLNESDDKTFEAKGEFSVYFFDEDKEDDEVLTKFVKALADKGIYLEKRTDSWYKLYHEYSVASFNKSVFGETFYWGHFVDIVRKLFKEFGKEVAMSGNFKVEGDDEVYNFDARGDSPEDAVIYFDNQ